MDAKGESAAMEQNVHDGHRLRVKQRFLAEGLEHYEHHQILEMLLFYGFPRKDTNELAHQLIRTFGSLSRVLEAPYEELVRVKGMSANAAVLVSFCGQLLQAYYKDKFATGMVLHTTEETGRFLLPYFLGRKNEAVALICLDNRCKVLNCSVIFEGSVNSTEINIRLVLQHALMHNATAVILAHNHPSGHALPSREDIDTTIAMAKALTVADIRLLDHIIIAENDFISMRDTASLKAIFHCNWREPLVARTAEQSARELSEGTEAV